MPGFFMPEEERCPTNQNDRAHIPDAPASPILGIARSMPSFMPDRMKGTNVMPTPTPATATSGERSARNILSTIPSANSVVRQDEGPKPRSSTTSRQLVKAAATNGTTSCPSAKAATRPSTDVKRTDGTLKGN